LNLAFKRVLDPLTDFPPSLRNKIWFDHMNYSLCGSKAQEGDSPQK